MKRWLCRVLGHRWEYTVGGLVQHYEMRCDRCLAIRELTTEETVRLCTWMQRMTAEMRKEWLG